MALSLRYLIFASWLLGVFFPGAVFAQAASVSTPGAPIAFTVFARDRPADLQFLPADELPPETLAFFGNTRSPIYRHRGASVAFYNAAELTAWWRARAADPRKTPPRPAPVAVAQVAPGIERALFLFIPALNPAAGEPRFNVYVVDDSPHSLPAGHASVINASGREYLAKLGGQLLEVPHGAGGKIPVQGTVEMRLATQEGEGWVLGGRHTFRLGESERVSLVFFPPTSPTGVAPIIRTLVERLPAGKAAAAPHVGGARVVDAD
jgi:hypothetical protein